jgi:hypothetical protein
MKGVLPLNFAGPSLREVNCQPSVRDPCILSHSRTVAMAGENKLTGNAEHKYIARSEGWGEWHCMGECGSGSILEARQADLELMLQNV